MDPLFTLLVVGAEKQQQELIEGVLQAELSTLEIITTHSSADTMALIYEKNDIQCIIVNSALENGNGFLLIQEIRTNSQYAKTPVLIMSDIKERDYLLKAAASGASDFILKPFSPRSLTLKLKKLLASKQFRKFPRTPTLGFFNLSVQFDTAAYDCTLVDISTGGCSIKAPPFNQGGAICDHATITIDNNGTAITVKSEFTRAEKDLECEDLEEKSQIAGFQFINPNEETALAISSFINSVGN